MKKAVSILVMLSLVLSLAMLFAGCGKKEHVHLFESTFEYDENHHWNSCRIEGCDATIDKEPHSWGINDGNVYRCTKCGYSKTIQGLTEAEWNAMLGASNFTNYTLTAQSKTEITTLADNSKMNVSVTNITKFADGKVHNSFTSVIDGEQSSGEKLYEGTEADITTNSYSAMFAALKYDLFTFNPNNNKYEALQPIEVPVLYIYYGLEGETPSVNDSQTWDNVEIEVLDGKLFKVSYKTTVSYETLGTTSVDDATLTFSDYGTTTIDNGGSSSSKLTEAEWNEMLSASTLTNYTLSYEESYVNKTFAGEVQETVHAKVDVRFTAQKMAEKSTDLLVEDPIWLNWYVYQTGESEKYSHEWIFMTLLNGKFNDWAYDNATGTYYAPNGVIASTNIEIPLLFEMSSGTLKISDGKLSEAIFNVTITDITYGLTSEGVFSYTFSNYGTTVIHEDITPDPPANIPVA